MDELECHFVDAELSIRCPEYIAYDNMKFRCYNLEHKGAKYYSGRGIKVCARWLTPKIGRLLFLYDMGKKPDPKYSLDRIDSDGSYSPDNCRWVDSWTQSWNRRPYFS
jgi:hypothetical protein